MISIKKVPIINVGDYVYQKSDPDKVPTKWRIWSYAEWIGPENFEFIDKKGKEYKWVVKISFKWTFRI